MPVTKKFPLQPFQPFLSHIKIQLFIKNENLKHASEKHDVRRVYSGTDPKNGYRYLIDSRCNEAFTFLSVITAFCSSEKLK
ncbi:MAG: hypothetical protein V4556_04615 [Bacteroidota bacterium]